MSASDIELMLAREYTFNVFADPDGGYVVVFPDLPECMTQVDTIEEVSRAANEIRELWLETAFETGIEIPEPSYPESYSGKFNVRLPRSLHRRLAERANDEGVSLNQLVVALLAGGIERRDPVEEVSEKENVTRPLAAVG